MKYVDNRPDRELQDAVARYLITWNAAGHAPTITDIADAIGHSSNAVGGVLRRFHRHGMTTVTITDTDTDRPHHTLTPAVLDDLDGFLSRLPLPAGGPATEPPPQRRPRLDRTLATVICHMVTLDDPITAEALGACLGIDHTKTMGVLKRLVAAEWAVRGPATDNTYPTWQLTGLGERRARVCATYLNQAVTPAPRHVTPARAPRHVTAKDITARINPDGGAELTFTSHDTADHNGIQHTTIVHLDDKLLDHLRDILNTG